jgi:hypothetical protein
MLVSSTTLQRAPKMPKPPKLTKPSPNKPAPKSKNPAVAQDAASAVAVTFAAVAAAAAAAAAAATDASAHASGSSDPSAVANGASRDEIAAANAAIAANSKGSGAKSGSAIAGNAAAHVDSSDDTERATVENDPKHDVNDAEEEEEDGKELELEQEDEDEDEDEEEDIGAWGPPAAYRRLVALGYCHAPTSPLLAPAPLPPLPSSVSSCFASASSDALLRQVRPEREKEIESMIEAEQRKQCSFGVITSEQRERLYGRFFCV